MRKSPTKKYTAEEKLREDIKDGGITLVLGSGINGKILPDWKKLLSLAKKSMEKTVPGKETDVLSLMRSFEQLGYRNLGEYTATKVFVKKFKQALYKCYKDNPGKAKTLKAIANVLFEDTLSECPKIRRVITFNVDSLLEESILLRNRNQGSDDSRVTLHPITQWYQAAMHHTPSIDIYHLHGFLPSSQYKEEAPKLIGFQETPDGLIFGDDQYWDMTSRPSSLPNVIMLNALHDSHCVFIGLSMKDPNIARWLALRANEIKASKWAQSGGRADHLGDLLTRHYWFQAKPDPLTKVWLKSRGVRTIALKKWDDFEEVFKSVFKETDSKK